MDSDQITAIRNALDDKIRAAESAVTACHYDEAASTLAIAENMLPKLQALLNPTSQIHARIMDNRRAQILGLRKNISLGTSGQSEKVAELAFAVPGKTFHPDPSIDQLIRSFSEPNRAKVQRMIALWHHTLKPGEREILFQRPSPKGTATTIIKAAPHHEDHMIVVSPTPHVRDALLARFKGSRALTANVSVLLASISMDNVSEFMKIAIQYARTAK
jgi:hypothetical protein